MSWCYSDNRLVGLCNLGLQLVNLLQVFTKSIVVAFTLHVEHSPKIRSITPVLALGRRDIDCPHETILVHGADTTANLMGETGGQRVISVLLVQIQDAQTANMLTVNIILEYNKKNML